MTMAIEVFSEISSPRISFSYHLNNAEANEEQHHIHHQRLDTSLLDFDFSFGNSFVQELSASADELFSNGKILPIEINKTKPIVAKQAHGHRQPEPAPQTATATDNTVKKRLKEFLSTSIDEDDKPAFKSFWQFKRCISLNSESSTRSKSLIRSLDQFLSRSNSTGSAPNRKPTMFSKETRKQSSLSRKSSVSSSSSSGAFYSYSNSTQKPPCGAYGNGVRVSSVLNLPHPLISNATVSLFGSRFCNGKVKRKKNMN